MRTIVLLIILLFIVMPWFLVALSRDGRIVIDASQQVKADKYLVV